MKKKFSSLDRQTTEICDYQRPDRYRDILSIDKCGHLIPRGSGLSYVAASFGGGAISVGMDKFNRILSFDPSTKLIKVEAGITVGNLQKFLFCYGLTIAVQPGHPNITIGGCIACDVHGKNQTKEGLFDSVIDSLTLFHPSHGEIILSRQHNADIFELTCGGYGLTGIILDVTLRLSDQSQKSVRQYLIPVAGLLETRDAIADQGDAYDFVYSWNDLASQPMGRGFLVGGKLDQEEMLTDWSFSDLNKNQPFFHPSIFRRETAPIINAYYNWNMRRKKNGLLTPIFEFTYPAAKLGFYFSLYGSRGFIEHQVLIPEHAYKSWIFELLKILKNSNETITLASVKAFEGKSNLLRYNGTGYSVSLDMPATPAALNLLNEIDSLDCDHGAIANIYKDSRLTDKVVARQYRNLDVFKQRIACWDPMRRFTSSLAKRIGI